MAKRQYSRANTPRTDRNVHINIARVPPTLRDDFRAKCRRGNISQRALLLGWIRNWVNGRRPDDDGTDAAELEAPEVAGVDNSAVSPVV